MAKRVGITMHTPVFRVSFPKVFEPVLNTMSKKMEYSLVALFPEGEELLALKDAAFKVTKETWGKRLPKNLKSPFKDQAEREVTHPETDEKTMPDGYVKGRWMVQMKSKDKPEILDRKNGKKHLTDPSKFYAGCYAMAEVYVSTYEVVNEGAVVAAGVSLNVNSILKWDDGEPFSTRRKAEAAFAAIEAESDGDAEPSSAGEVNPFA